MQKDVVIIGAGASGLMCAIEAGRRNRSVIIIDHAKRPAEKVRISGGGYCNFTNLNISDKNYLSNNPHFCKSAIARFTPNHFIELLDKHNVRYYEKEEGQMFCKDGSAAIIKMLLNECEKVNVQIALNCRVEELKPHPHINPLPEGEENSLPFKGRVRVGMGFSSGKTPFQIKTNSGTIESESLVIATGGLSYPAIGATDFGYTVAKQFGINTIHAKPALVPLMFSSDEFRIFKELSGISIDALVTYNKRTFRGNILFTHKGLSGPAILNASLYYNSGETPKIPSPLTGEGQGGGELRSSSNEKIQINLMPDTNIMDILTSNRQSRMMISTLLSQFFPDRFSRAFCESYINQKMLNQYSDKELRNIAQQIHNWTITPSGTEGFKKAEVTSGGIDTEELSSKTMESNKVHGLFFTGEVTDVTGQLGGYNLHWAWASGFAAGQYV
ncbi:MAG: NAD(P)/FAD-dependent oxidoreductase [Nitrospirae bacterium]|nr:NAD(P)/FAD-dependent oxidoreductase [Nitrospirota bacterium]